MAELFGGLLMFLGGGMLCGSCYTLHRHSHGRGVSVAECLRFTPFAAPDPTLEQIAAEADQALSGAP